MSKAAIYTRVSTDNQEAEGTSLQTQLEYCLKYCQDKDYDILYRFSETYSGLSLDRPKLSELRELIRAGKIDVIVVYSLDRWTRDPGHGVILMQEYEKAHIKLEAVSETVESNELGKLISYIRGFASKMEAEKIRERTMRGKRERAKQGNISSGSHASLYGYDYVPVNKNDRINTGKRVINEIEAKWVRQIFQWLVADGWSTNAITYKLRELNVPTPGGAKYWDRSTVYRILRNENYYGKTYAFTVSYGEAKKHIKPEKERKSKYTGAIHKDRSEWIEIAGVTPPLISQEVFEAAQRQLGKNKVVHPTNRDYLLHGFLYCKRCGRAYQGTTALYQGKDRQYEYQKYRCSGKLRKVSPVKCDSSIYKASELEKIVWTEVDAILNDSKRIRNEIEKLNQAPQQIEALEQRSTDVLHEIMALDREQDDLLDNALKNGFKQENLLKKNLQINAKRDQLKADRAETQISIDKLKKSLNNLQDLEKYIELVKSKISKKLTFEDKRLALRMLGVKVYVDGNAIEIICEPIRETLLIQAK